MNGSQISFTHEAPIDQEFPLLRKLYIMMSRTLPQELDKINLLREQLFEIEGLAGGLSLIHI